MVYKTKVVKFRFFVCSRSFSFYKLQKQIEVAPLNVKV